MAKAFSKHTKVGLTIEVETLALLEGFSLTSSMGFINLQRSYLKKNTTCEEQLNRYFLSCASCKYKGL